MTIKKWITAIAGYTLSLGAMAGTMGQPLIEEYRPWSVIGSLGYTWYNNFYNGVATADAFAQAAIGDGQTALGRFAIARDLGTSKQYDLVLKLEFKTAIQPALIFLNQRLMI